MSSAPESSAAMIPQAEQTPMDGSAGLEARRKRRHMFYSGFLGVYLVTGLVFYGVTEGWNVLESTVFVLSVVTGVGYGHLVPTSKAGLVFTAFYVICGLVVFATVAGHILDYLIGGEVDALKEAVRHFNEGNHDHARLSVGEKRQQRRWNHFLVGTLNVIVISLFSLILFMTYFGMAFPEAIYNASISVMKLDSICLLAGVQCSHGHHAHGGGQTGSLIFSIIWALTTYAVVGHFLVAASNYFGTDAPARMTRISTVTSDRIMRMDSDGDNKVTRSEFLRDRLIQGEVCDKAQIDSILRNFDDMDKDGSGVLNSKDLK